MADTDWEAAGDQQQDFSQESWELGYSDEHSSSALASEAESMTSVTPLTDVMSNTETYNPIDEHEFMVYETGTTTDNSQLFGPTDVCRRLSTEVHSYFSQSESGAEVSKTNDDDESVASRATSAESEDAEVAWVPICYQPTTSLISQMVECGGDSRPQMQQTSLGPRPCPVLRFCTYHKDTLMFQIPPTVYNKMVNWGCSELVAVAERRIKARDRELGIASSDRASAFQIKLCCAVLVIIVIYDIATVSYLLFLNVVIPRWWGIAGVFFLAAKTITPYVMALTRAFNPGYFIWLSAWLIILTLKFVVLVEIILTICKRSTRFVNAEEENMLTKLTVGVPAVVLVILTDGLTMAAACVFKQINDLEERLLRVVDIYERPRKKLSAAPFQLWCAGLYNVDKGSSMGAPLTCHNLAGD